MFVLVSSNVDTEKAGEFSLPWWFRFIAWCLLIVTVLLSTTFVLFYGITFKDPKVQKWLTSLAISFITSIFFTQPIKVLHINSTVLFAC